jgi:hypothetical protein
MISVMMRRWLTRAMTAAVILASPALALADDSTPLIDARAQGYRQTLTPPPGSTALAWLCFVVLGIVGAGVMFMNAKRTHLD